ncbi:hypothetical protein FQA39_LY01278 [Lamprigera yunnana]|nr:hypothetical protein FQA39_LY01278 [Lamprigera yunnana]
MYVVLFLTRTPLPLGVHSRLLGHSIIRKPLMEKKRRARVNDSLETLKQILLESKTTLQESSQRKNGQRTTKLAKADILEMTVRYLQYLHNKLGQIQRPKPIKTKKVSIRSADRSSDIGLKIGVTLIPTRLDNGYLTFVMPSSMDGISYHNQLQKDFSEETNESAPIFSVIEGIGGMAFGESYVKWKLLLGFGTIFWVLLCLHDMYTIDSVTEFYYPDHGEHKWLSTVPKEEINAEPVLEVVVDETLLIKKGYTLMDCVIFWNVLIFITTITLCLIRKVTNDYLKLRSKENGLFHQTLFDVVKKSNSSKIPVLSSSKSTFNISAENSESTFKSNSNASLKSGDSDKPARDVAKETLKHRNDVVTMRAISITEHAVVSKKLENVSREKRELARKLKTANRETHAARNQVEQLLSEKCSLLERLQCATKEFRENTKSKKNALAKLEKSQGNVTALMQELDKLKAEKANLEIKIKEIDMENRQLKEIINGYARIKSKTETIKENEITQTELTEEDAMEINEAEIDQSHRDVQRVQKRLMDLEKSLDKLKLTSWGTGTEFSLQLEKQRSEDRGHMAIPTRPETPFESNTIFTDNLTDEQRQHILVPDESSGDEASSAVQSSKNPRLDREKLLEQSGTSGDEEDDTYEQELHDARIRDGENRYIGKGIFGGGKEDIWFRRTNEEIRDMQRTNTQYQVKAARLRWLGHSERQETDEHKFRRKKKKAKTKKKMVECSHRRFKGKEGRHKLNGLCAQSVRGKKETYGLEEQMKK